MSQEQIDCIVRFHDARRLLELKRCVFSLVGQTYRPLNIILTVQRFSTAQIAAVRQALEPVLRLPNAPTLTIANWDEPAPADARTALLNLGLRTGEGRYVAFLDYDDVLYPEAYELLTGQLRKTGAGIAFATVRVVRAQVHRHFVQVNEVITPPFSGETLRDLFRSNFCPIHSYMLDREAVPSHLLQFDESLSHEEDYDFLLRVCAEVQADFELIKVPVGDYYYKTDGSNSVPTEGGLRGEKLAGYERLQTVLEARRRMTLVSNVVQESLGIVPPRPNATIRDTMMALSARDRMIAQN
jgi:hypothetical protein